MVAVMRGSIAAYAALAAPACRGVLSVEVYGPLGKAMPLLTNPFLDLLIDDRVTHTHTHTCSSHLACVHTPALPKMEFPTPVSIPCRPPLIKPHTTYFGDVHLQGKAAPSTSGRALNSGPPRARAPDANGGLLWLQGYKGTKFILQGIVVWFGLGGQCWVVGAGAGPRIFEGCAARGLVSNGSAGGQTHARAHAHARTLAPARLPGHLPSRRGPASRPSSSSRPWRWWP
jgi:hypothetical protein